MKLKVDDMMVDSKNQNGRSQIEIEIERNAPVSWNLQRGALQRLLIFCFRQRERLCPVLR